MTASAIMLVAVAAMFALFAGMQRTAAREASRSNTTDLVRVAIDRMTKDIRQASSVDLASTASVLTMDGFVNGVPATITYDATASNILTRTVDGNTVTLLERMTITTVFTYAPSVEDPSVITVQVTAKPETFSIDEAAISLASEVRLRNR